MRDKRKISWRFCISTVVGIWILMPGIALTAEIQSRYEPSGVCGACHADIHGMWANGMHAHAYDDPIFQTSFLQAFFETTGGATASCLRCHDPTSRIPEDFDVKKDIIETSIV